MSRLCIGIVFFAVSMANGILLRFVINKYLFDFPLFLLSVQYGLTLFALELARYGYRYTRDNYRERCWGHSIWFILFPIHWNRVEHWHRSRWWWQWVNGWIRMPKKERVFPCSRLLNVSSLQYSLLFSFFSFYLKRRDRLCRGHNSAPLLFSVSEQGWRMSSTGSGIDTRWGMVSSRHWVNRCLLYSSNTLLCSRRPFNWSTIIRSIVFSSFYWSISSWYPFPCLSNVLLFRMSWEKRCSTFSPVPLFHFFSTWSPYSSMVSFSTSSMFSPRPLTVPCRRRSSTTFDQPFKWVLFEQCLYS